MVRSDDGGSRCEVAAFGCFEVWGRNLRLLCGMWYGVGRFAPFEVWGVRCGVCCVECVILSGV